MSEPPNWRVRLTLIAFLTLVASGLLWLWVQPRTYLDFWRRGNDAYMRGDDDLAIQEFTAAIQEGPEDPGGYRGRGYAYTSKQEWSRALDDIDIGVKDGVKGAKSDAAGKHASEDTPQDSPTSAASGGVDKGRKKQKFNFISKAKQKTI